MRVLCKLALLTTLAPSMPSALTAQDLAPRAYVISPLHSNAVTLSYSFYKGHILLDGALPVSNATGTINIPVLSFYHSFSFFGRSANIIASLPYGVGDFHGNVVGSTKTSAYRSGLMDGVFRFAVNLKGGPALTLDEFRKRHEKTVIGGSLKVVVPTGQYDALRPLNWGTIDGPSSRSWAILMGGVIGSWMGMVQCGSSQRTRSFLTFRHPVKRLNPKIQFWPSKHT